MRMRARAWTGLLATTGLLVGTMAVAGAPVAVAGPTCHGKPVTMVVEGKDDDVNYGTKGDDVVLLKGADWHTFYGKGGDDTICATEAGAMVYGGPGDDWISGEQTTRGVELHGGEGDDVLIGSDYGDIYDGNELYGGEGSDVIHAEKGNDDIYPDHDDFDDNPKQDAADTIYSKGSDRVYVTMLSPSNSAKDTIHGKPSLEISGVPVKLNVAKHRLQAAAGGPVDDIGGGHSFTVNAKADITGSSGEDGFSIWGAGTRLKTKGGADWVEIGAKNADVSTGSGDDEVYFSAPGKKNKVSLGHGDDKIHLEGSHGVKVKGGPGDDRFDIWTHGELGEGEGEHDDLFPMRATLLGKSGKDTLTWDCKSKTDARKGTLKCTHKKAKIKFGGMQVYKASRNLDWKDLFHGSSHADVFYGGGKDDVMYGHGGKDTLIGGKGYDVARGGKGKDTCKAEKKYSC